MEAASLRSGSVKKPLRELASQAETCLPKVLFEPFMGISPRRYRDIFEKRKRKDREGKTQEWYEGEPIPQIEDRNAAYLENEQGSIISALGMLARLNIEENGSA
jgi:hypothetical protein